MPTSDDLLNAVVVSQYEEQGDVATATDLDGMGEDELKLEVTRLRQYVNSASPYARQRMAAGILSGKVLSDLVGPEGEANRTSLYGAIREAALGYIHRSYCGTPGCDNNGRMVKCPDCGEARIIREGPDWKAVESLLKFVVPEATITEEALQEEFIVSVGNAAVEAFDEANGFNTPDERKQAFAAALGQRFGIGDIA